MAGISFSGNATGTIGEGVVIEKNVAGSGGGVIVQGGANIKMTGGTVRNHSVTGYGGGIYVHNSVFTMTGGEISENIATGAAGGILNKGTVHISGGVICGILWLMEHFGLVVILITPAALLTYIPLALVLVGLWFLIGHLL